MNQSFVITGVNSKQASLISKIQGRAYLEGQLDATSTGVAGLSAGFATAKLARLLGGFVTAGEVTTAGAAAFTVAEGTIMATMLTTVVPIIGGALIGVGIGYGVRYIGRKGINSIKELDLSEAIKNGDIEIIDSEETAKRVNAKECGLMLFSNPDWGDDVVTKKAAAVKVEEDKSTGDNAETASIAATGDAAQVDAPTGADKPVEAANQA